MSTELSGSIPSYDELTGTLGVTVVGGGAVSFIGMIVQSTTLDTMDKVIALYGGVEWTKIEGKFLLGVSDNHAVNSEGGYENAQLPEHYHTGGTYTGDTADMSMEDVVDVSVGTTNLKYTSGSASARVVSSTSSMKETRSHHHSFQVPFTPTPVSTHAENTTVVNDGEGVNMPPFKTVYIWERTA